MPPPISAIGLWPVCCSQCSIMIGTSEPTCSDGRGAVEADIGGDRLGAREFVERLRLGNLMDEAALDKLAQEIGLVVAHRTARLRIAGGLAGAGPVV